MQEMHSLISTAGMLGMDFLSQFDTDFDHKEAVLRLWPGPDTACSPPSPHVKTGELPSHPSGQSSGGPRLGSGVGGGGGPGGGPTPRG